MKGKQAEGVPEAFTGYKPEAFTGYKLVVRAFGDLSIQHTDGRSLARALLKQKTFLI